MNVGIQWTRYFFSQHLTDALTGGTTDNLAYQEMNLTFQWLLKVGHTAGQWTGKRDARMLLRKARVISRNSRSASLTVSAATTSP